jgi:hypothetical protein
MQMAAASHSTGEFERGMPSAASGNAVNLYQLSERKDLLIVVNVQFITFA